MKVLVPVLVLLATAAWAGEKLLGKLVVNDGGTTSNRCSGYSGYAATGAFVVPVLAKITIQCDSDAYVLTDAAGCDAGQCIKLTAGTLFPTSVNVSKTLSCGAFNSDGGVAAANSLNVSYTGGHVAMSPLESAAAGAITTCRVFSRAGTE